MRNTTFRLVAAVYISRVPPRKTPPAAAYPTVDERPDPATLAQLTALAAELVAADAEVAAIEERLKVARKVAAELGESRIPAAMRSLGLTDVGLDDGSRIKVVKVASCKVSEPRRAAAIGWLDANGDGGLVKRTIVAFFPREKQDEATALLDHIKARGIEDVAEKAWVEPQTLLKHLKELKAAGIPFPEETFGWFEKLETEVTRAKG